MTNGISLKIASVFIAGKDYFAHVFSFVLSKQIYSSFIFDLLLNLFLFEWSRLCTFLSYVGIIKSNWTILGILALQLDITTEANIRIPLCENMVCVCSIDNSIVC